MRINSAGDRDEESPVGHHSCPVKLTHCMIKPSIKALLSLDQALLLVLLLLLGLSPQAALPSLPFTDRTSSCPATALMMSNSRKPPSPNLSRTFWTPEFSEFPEEAVWRAHPIPRWGDYNHVTGLYVWQKERFKGGATSRYVLSCKKALAGMWYGVERTPRCNHCEKADRSCTLIVAADVDGPGACARCRLAAESNCSFANGGRRILSAAVCQWSI
jgi:hypothetical protein